MAIEKKTVVSQIEVVRPSGGIQIEMRKLIFENGAQIADLGFHRTSFAPGSDINEVKSILNIHLAQLGAGPLVDADWITVKAHADLTWTPEVLAAWEAKGSADT